MYGIVRADSQELLQWLKLDYFRIIKSIYFIFVGESEYEAELPPDFRTSHHEEKLSIINQLVEQQPLVESRHESAGYHKTAYEPNEFEGKVA